MAQAEQDLIQLITGSYKSSILYGAVVDEEPKEHPEALVEEDPEAVVELLIETPEAEKSRNLLSNRLSRAIIDKAAEKLTRLSRLKKLSSN